MNSFDYNVSSLIVPGEVSILGITGQAGAGKTNYITPRIKKIAESYGVPADYLGMDSFFRLSSRGRKSWIEEGGKISDEEAAYRKDQINWWDFDWAFESLYRLKEGKPLSLEGVYNRSDGGELTGTVHIEPPNEGMLLIFEGVPIAHLKHAMNKLAFVYAPSDIRLNRLRDRDRHRKGDEVKERFRITQDFETRYYPRYWEAIDMFLDNSNSDNGGPRVIDYLSPDRALY